MTHLSSRLYYMLVAVMLLGMATPTSSVYGQPNFVLIVVDDLSPIEDRDDPEAANVYSGDYPNISALMAAGMKFRTMYATAICTSSRVELMTGQYGFNNGYYGLLMDAYAPEPGTPYYDIGAKPSIAKMLRERNYRTGIVGKWQLTGVPLRGMVYDTGFEEYYVRLDSRHFGLYPGLPMGTTSSRYWDPDIVENGKLVETTADDYGPDLFATWAENFIHRHKDERFFLYYPMVLVHKQAGEYPEVPDGSGGVIPGTLRSHVDYVDSIVGRIVSALEGADVADNTMVIFTADNGSQWEGFKATPTEQGVRVPFVVKYPGVVPPGVVTRQVADFVDITATIIEYAGESLIPAPGPVLDGKSLSWILEEPNQSGTVKIEPEPDPADPHQHYAFGYYQNMRVIRDDEYLYQEVNELGNGELYYCGINRNFSGCELTVDPAKELEFQQALTDFPPPDIDNQQLFVPQP